MKSQCSDGDEDTLHYSSSCVRKSTSQGPKHGTKTKRIHSRPSNHEYLELALPLKLTLGEPKTVS